MKLKTFFQWVIVPALILSGCGGVTPAPTEPTVDIDLPTVYPTDTNTPPPTAPFTPTRTLNPTFTSTVTETSTPTSFPNQTIYDTARPVPYKPSIDGIYLDDECDVTQFLLLITADAGAPTVFTCVPMNITGNALTAEARSDAGEPFNGADLKNKYGYQFDQITFAFIIRLPASRNSEYNLSGYIDDQCDIEIRDANGFATEYLHYDLGYFGTGGNPERISGSYIIGTECKNTGGLTILRITAQSDDGFLVK